MLSETRGSCLMSAFVGVLGSWWIQLEVRSEESLPKTFPCLFAGTRQKRMLVVTALALVTMEAVTLLPLLALHQLQPLLEWRPLC